MTLTGPELLADGWAEAVSGALEGILLPAAADGTAQFTVSGAPGGRPAAFVVTVRAGRVSLSAGRVRGADAALAWTFADFASAWSGEMSPEAAYMTGRMKVDGDRVLLIDGWRALRTSPEVRAALAGSG